MDGELKVFSQMAPSPVLHLRTPIAQARDDAPPPPTLGGYIWAKTPG